MAAFKSFAWTVGAAATKIKNDTGTGYEDPDEAAGSGAGLGGPGAGEGHNVTQVLHLIRRRREILFAQGIPARESHGCAHQEEE